MSHASELDLEHAVCAGLARGGHPHQDALRVPNDLPLRGRASVRPFAAPLFTDLTYRERAALEESRAALADALRSVALAPAARLLEVLPPAGVDGWVSAWTVGVGLAQGAADRWKGAVHDASRCAVEGRDREELAHLGTELAAVGKEASALVERLATSPAE